MSGTSIAGVGHDPGAATNPVVPPGATAPEQFIPDTRQLSPVGIGGVGEAYYVGGAFGYGRVLDGPGGKFNPTQVGGAFGPPGKLVTSTPALPSRGFDGFQDFTGVTSAGSPTAPSAAAS